MRTEGFSGYIVHGFLEAIPCLEDEVLVQHSSRGMAQVLEECRTAKEANLALRLHGWLCERGVDAQTIQGNYVVAMLVESGSMCHAQQLFCRLTARIQASWSALIVGLINHGKNQLALTMHLNMRNIDFMDVSGHTVVPLLQACADLRDVERGLQLHADLLKTELLQRDPFVGSALLEMYSKCGSFFKIKNIFDDLTNHDVVLWTTLMTAYVEHGHIKEALTCLEQMQKAGIAPDAVTFVCGLKACDSMHVQSKVHELHTHIERRGLLSSNFVIGSVLIDTYAKCGLLVEAQEVFDRLQVCDTILWNVLISGYLEKGQTRLALDVFNKMKLQDIVPDCVTYIHVLKACSNLCSVTMGQEIHMEISRRDLIERHALLGSTLVDMYIKCKSLTKAREVFDKLLLRDSILWNIMIAGYFEHSCDIEALECFEMMAFEGFDADTVTYGHVLRLYGRLGVTDLGEMLHAEIVKAGLLETSLFIGNNLIEMYINFSLLTKAKQVFDTLYIRDVISWNALITGYAKHGYYEEALKCYGQLHTDGVSPDITTIVCCLNIYADLKAINKGQKLHVELGRLGLVMADVSVASALVDMYAKCGCLVKAEEVFHSYPVQDVVMWNALITGYVENNHTEAFLKFEQMQLAGCAPSPITVVAIFKACGKIGAVHRGQEMHTEVTAKGLFDGDLMVRNTLIDMYAKAGSIVTAQHLFDQRPVNTKDSSSWNALIAGYAQLGKSGEVFVIFNKMVSEGDVPDFVTFSILLSASRLVNKCLDYVCVEREGYRNFPIVEHHIDMLTFCVSQVEKLERAAGFRGKLPSRPDFIMWHQVLTSCKKWGNVELAEKVFKEAISRDLLGNILEPLI